MTNGTKKLQRKLRGKLYVQRDRHLQALKAGLDDREFRLLEIYRDLIDWDPSHIETHMTFDVLDVNVAPLLGWSPSKVSRVRRLLEQKNVIARNEEGLGIIADQTDATLVAKEIFLDMSPVQDKIAFPQEQVAPMHKGIAPVQSNRGYKPPSPLVSFKGDSVSLLPCDRYLKLERSGQFGAMTADDMEFLEPSSSEWQLVRDRILAG